MLLVLQKLSMAYAQLNCLEEEELFFLLAIRLSTILFTPVTGKVLFFSLTSITHLRMCVFVCDECV